MKQKNGEIKPKWKCIKSTIVFDHTRMKLAEDDVELPNGKVIKYIHYANKSNGGVTLLCVRGDMILVQKEYSYPVDEVLYQFPGGKIEAGETVIEAAERELIEESGLKAESIEELGWFYPDNRRTSAKMYVVLVKESTETTKVGGDLEEDIKSEWIAISDFQEMIKNGEIVNYSALAAWALFTSQQ